MTGTFILEFHQRGACCSMTVARDGEPLPAGQATHGTLTSEERREHPYVGDWVHHTITFAEAQRAYPEHAATMERFYGKDGVIVRLGAEDPVVVWTETSNRRADYHPSSGDH